MGRVAPIGTVTLLFTDVEGSTDLWESEPESMRVALRRHDEIVAATIDLTAATSSPPGATRSARPSPNRPRPWTPRQPSSGR